MTQEKQVPQFDEAEEAAIRRKNRRTGLALAGLIAVILWISYLIRFAMWGAIFAK